MEPVTPVEPVAPVSPVGPLGPVAPVGPESPVVPAISGPSHWPEAEMIGPTPVIAIATAPVGAIVTSEGLICWFFTSSACCARPANGIEPIAILGDISESQPAEHEVFGSQTCMPRNSVGFAARNSPSDGVNGFTEPRLSDSRPCSTATSVQHSAQVEAPPLAML